MKIYGMDYETNSDGYVEYLILEGQRVYPYTLDKRINAWNQRSGELKPATVRKGIASGRIKIN